MHVSSCEATSAALHSPVRRRGDAVHKRGDDERVGETVIRVVDELDVRVSKTPDVLWPCVARRSVARNAVAKELKIPTDMWLNA
jgi:hypothetical protein